METRPAVQQVTANNILLYGVSRPFPRAAVCRLDAPHSDRNRPLGCPVIGQRRLAGTRSTMDLSVLEGADPAGYRAERKLRETKSKHPQGDCMLMLP